MDHYLQYVGGTVGAAVITGAAISTAMYLACKAQPITPLVDLDNQTDELPGPDKARISRLCDSNNKYIKRLYDDVQTLYDIMYSGMKISNDGPCLGSRQTLDSPYEWISYSQVLERCRRFGAGLLQCNLTPSPTTFVGIFAKNSVEWVLTENACYHYSMVIVPLYDTLGPEACSFIIQQASISLVICDEEVKVESMLKQTSETPSLKTIVYIQDISPETVALAREKGVTLLSYQEVEELGKTNPHKAVPPKPSDLATVCYTSGTTGNPKGVMLTHDSILTCVSAVMYQFGEFAPRHGDTMLSFLPLAHMLERCCETAVYMTGGQIGFYGGDIRYLMDDMIALRPTITPCVPRILNKIHDKVHSSVSGSRLKTWLLNTALKNKQAELDRHVVTNNGIWDRIVFKRVRDSLGGRVRLMVVGSAPISSNVLTFARCALGCMIVEGYGQTECVAPCTLTIPGDNTTGHVGPPIPCCQIKLADVPEMEYYASNSQGEICVQGPNVFQGYFKDPEKTAETIDSEGWLHTGDIGMWLPNGALKVMDRKKHIFKLSQGEYIAPEKIENIYQRSVFVSHIFVYGESLKSCLVAIVAPDKEVLTNWCNENEVRGSWLQICDNKEVKKAVMNDMIAEGKKTGLKSFEQVKDIYLYDGVFMIENGLLTPTLKTKRPECRKFFMPQIEAMYSSLD